MPETIEDRLSRTQQVQKRLEVALATMLDQVDYTTGACRMNEMIAAVLPTEIIRLAREALVVSRRGAGDS